MLTEERTSEIFSDARVLYSDAMEMLEMGKLRNAAEKAWGATKRATDALILARTGREPRSSGQTIRGIRSLGRTSAEFRQMELRCTNRAQVLHGLCFYDGNCEPSDLTRRDVRETIDYIEDAESLARRGD